MYCLLELSWVLCNLWKESKGVSVCQVLRRKWSSKSNRTLGCRGSSPISIVQRMFWEKEACPSLLAALRILGFWAAAVEREALGVRWGREKSMKKSQALEISLDTETWWGRTYPQQCLVIDSPGQSILHQLCTYRETTSNLFLPPLFRFPADLWGWHGALLTSPEVPSSLCHKASTKGSTHQKHSHHDWR